MGTVSQAFFDRIEDEFTDALKTVSVHTPKVHGGGLFTAGHLFEAVADDAFAYLLLTNVHRKELHVVVVETVSEGKAYATVYEGATVSDAGTVLTECNHNSAYFAGIAEAVATHTPTVSDNGNLFAPPALMPGGTGPRTIGAKGHDGMELVVRPGGNLLIAVQNKGGAAKDICIDATWHEETALTFTTTTTSSTTTTTTTTTA